MLRVKPNTSKLWIFNYTHPHTKKRKNISFGSYPDISLKSAREQAEQARTWLAHNQDPKEQRENEHQERSNAAQNTLLAVSEAWFKVYQSKVKDRTYKNTRAIFENYVFPTLGNTPIEQITAPKVIAVVQKVIDRPAEVTANKQIRVQKGRPEVVKRLCQRFNNIMTFAVNSGLITFNPLTGITETFSSVKATNHPTINADELPQLLKTVRYANIKHITRFLFEFQLHTMTRPGEAAQAKWVEIDLDGRIWTLPAEKMKMGKEHKIPLTDHSLDILKLMQPISGDSDYVFPSMVKRNEHINTSTINVALKRMGYQGKLVAHGLRALASTILNENGFDPDLIEKALAHVDKNAVRRTYNRAEYLDKRREMMDWWSSYILRN